MHVPGNASNGLPNAVAATPDPIAVTIVDCAEPRPIATTQRITIGVDAIGDCPAIDPAAYDILLTMRQMPPAPWVTTADPLGEARRIAARVGTFPFASRVLSDLMRLQAGLDFDNSLIAESLAYSTLLGGGEFARWLAAQPLGTPDPGDHARLIVTRDDDLLNLTLSDPMNRNAMTAAMRDALYDILYNMLDDPTRPAVTIKAAGRCFSVGGHLPEFGSNRDLAATHAIRTERSCVSLLHRLGARASVLFHGAVIGSGLEVFAAAHHRQARSDAWFQLPELGMGLIPGAGGTVTVPRAIGAHRARWMMFGGRRIDARTAQAWGLVDRVIA